MVVNVVDKLLTPITLSPDAIMDLKNMDPNIRTLEKEILKAERAGIPVKELKERFEESKKLRRGLLKEYA